MSDSGGKHLLSRRGCLLWCGRSSRLLGWCFGSGIGRGSLLDSILRIGRLGSRSRLGVLENAQLGEFVIDGILLHGLKSSQMQKKIRVIAKLFTYLIAEANVAASAAAVKKRTLITFAKI